MESVKSILIIDGQRLALDLIANLLACDEAFNVAGKLAGAALAEGFLSDNGNVDLILSDTGIIGRIESIKRSYPGIKIVVTSESADIGPGVLAKAAGADSFVYKNISAEELIGTLKRTLCGYSVFPSTANADNAFSRLDPKELQIVRMLCGGLDKKAIAGRIGVSESTVKTRIGKILKKTGFTATARLTVYALNCGLVIPEAK